MTSEELDYELGQLLWKIQFIREMTVPDAVAYALGTKPCPVPEVDAVFKEFAKNLNAHMESVVATIKQEESPCESDQP